MLSFQCDAFFLPQVVAGLWSSGELTAQWALTAPGGTTGMALVTCTQTSGWVITTYMSWAPRETTASALTWRTGATSTNTPSTRASGRCHAQVTNTHTNLYMIAKHAQPSLSLASFFHCSSVRVCSLEDEEHQYRLHVSGFSGTVQDSFSWYHDKQGFSTPDSGNICAEISHGGWWYNQCFYANLNGVYYRVRVHILPITLYYSRHECLLLL